MTTTLEIVGLILLMIAAFQVNLTLGLTVTGVAFLFLGYALSS